MMPGRYGVIATPAADRIARGEEWLQTNTLDGQKAHDSFLKVGEAGFFQEYGPAGFHVSVGFANPAIINGRKAAVCAWHRPVRHRKKLHQQRNRHSHDRAHEQNSG